MARYYFVCVGTCFPLSWSLPEWTSLR